MVCPQSSCHVVAPGRRELIMLASGRESWSCGRHVPRIQPLHRTALRGPRSSEVSAAPHACERYGLGAWAIDLQLHRRHPPSNRACCNAAARRSWELPHPPFPTTLLWLAYQQSSDPHYPLSLLDRGCRHTVLRGQRCSSCSTRSATDEAGHLDSFSIERHLGNLEGARCSALLELQCLPCASADTQQGGAWVESPPA